MTSYDIISWGKNVVVFIRSQRKRQLNVTDGLLFHAILISHSSVDLFRPVVRLAFWRFQMVSYPSKFENLGGPLDHLARVLEHFSLPMNLKTSNWNDKKKHYNVR